MNGNEVLLKDIIPERFFWNAGTESPISIVQAPEGEMYDYYKDLYEPLNNNPPLGSVKIDDNAIQGSTLLANTSTLDDYDGLGALSYQWFANGESIDGATDKLLLLLTKVKLEKTTVSVSYMDGYGARKFNATLTDTVINNTFYFGGDGDGIFPNLDNAPIFDFSNVSADLQTVTNGEAPSTGFGLGIGKVLTRILQTRSFSLLFCRTLLVGKRLYQRY